ncbi:MAG: sigma-70 family RNA polymerase sigma factor, partial [Acidimicrobiia bacterium]
PLESNVTDQAIYEQVRGPMMRFAASLVGPDQADDLVSEVVVSTLKQRPLDSLDNPQAYLMQAVLNRAKSSRQRFSREREVLSRVARADSTYDAGYDQVIGDDVLRTVAGLPVQQRAAIYLVYWEDLEPTEAAELMGVRPATLRRYLHLARKKLRRFLDE